MNRLTFFLLITLPILFACAKQEQEVRVESISLSQSSAEIEIGKTLQLNATVSPSTAIRKDITWSSSQSSVASVSASGLVTALSEGTARITATADGKKGECTVTVFKGFVAVAEVQLEKAELTLYVGEEETLAASVLPDNATDKTITWATSDETIATVDGGKVTAVKEGEATVTASSDGKSATCIVNVDYIHVAEISLSTSEATLYAGESIILTANLSPDNITHKTVEWTSSDKGVATVDADGKVDAIGKGTATITAKADGKEAACQLTVLAPLKGVSLSKTALSLTVGESEALSVTLIPADATPREELTWSSSAPEVATVEGGVVKALTVGTATITATVEGFTAACVASVSKPAYTAPALSEVKVTDKFKAYDVNGYTDVTWYDNFSPKKQQYIYPHLLTSYVASEWYKVDNLEFIIMGEVPRDIECENIGRQSYNPSTHANRSYVHVRTLSPGATIKACAGGWDDGYEYFTHHPDKLLMVSVAADATGADDPEELTKSRHYQAFKQILNQSNVIASCTAGNIEGSVNKVLNEREQPVSGGSYLSASINSDLNNRYTVVGYYPGNNNVFLDDLECRMPVGFTKDTKNLVVLFPALYTVKYNDDTTTTCSMPTGAFSSSLGNFLSILLKTHPGVTLEGASTIMQENYFRAEKMKYKDDDGVVKEGGDWHFFKTDEFIASEILQKNAVDAAFSSSARVIDLPSSGGLCYIGPGILFAIDGTTFEMTEENRSTLVSAVSAGKDIKWTFNRELAENYATGSADITIRVLDHSGALIPDIKRTVSVGL